MDVFVDTLRGLHASQQQMQQQASKAPDCELAATAACSSLCPTCGMLLASKCCSRSCPPSCVVPLLLLPPNGFDL